MINRDRRVRALIFRAVKDKVAWQFQPLGHTGVQIRNLILNKRDYPTVVSLYRQIIRELWGRDLAAKINHYEFDMSVAKKNVLLGEIKELKVKRALLFWFPGTHGKISAQIELKYVEIGGLLEHCDELEIDYEHRIKRETLVLLEEHENILPVLGEYTAERELSDWHEKAKYADELKPMLSAPQENHRMSENAAKKLLKDTVRKT